MAGGEAASSGGSSSFLDQLKSAKASTGPCTVEEARSRGVSGGRPDSDYSSNAQGKTNINACSRKRNLPDQVRNIPGTKFYQPVTPDNPLCVDGKPYLDPEKIPGYDPVPLQDGNGHQVMGGDGNPVYGPSRGVSGLPGQANQLDGNYTSVARGTDLLKFRQAGPWDNQRLRDDDGSIIYFKKYRHFANIAIGYADAHGHYPSSEWIANGYAGLFSNFGSKEEMSKEYPNLPKSDVQDYSIGRALRVSRPPQYWLQKGQINSTPTPQGPPAPATPSGPPAPTTPKGP